MVKNKSINFLFFLSVIFLIFKIYTIYNSKLSLHGDEAQYWIWSKDLSLGYFSKPPLIAFLIRFFTTLFGESIFVIKFIPIIFYTISSYIIFLLGKKLFNKEVGLLSGLTFFLLPGVSLSSFIISTDVPLIFFWSLSLYLFYNLIQKPNFIKALMLGICIGLGFLSKYAMVYFFLCTFFYVLVDKEAYQKIKSAVKFYFFSFFIFLLIILPNIYWNMTNSWLTLGHTYDNASLELSAINLNEFVNFLTAQIFILGPTFFITCLFFYKKFFKMSGNSVFLVSYSIPVLVVVSIESIAVRAHGNWAAVSFVTLVIFIVSILSFKNILLVFYNNIINFLIGVVLFFTILTNFNIQIFEQLKGYNKLSKTIIMLSEKEGTKNIVIQDRMLYALISYHLRDFDFVFYIPGPSSLKITNHFQIKSSLPGNYNDNFIYIGPTNHIDYIKTPHIKKELKTITVNNKFKNVKIHKYTFD